MIYFFSFTAHTKVAKIVLSGEPDHSQPFGICWRAFIFFELFFRKKWIFNIKCSTI